MARRLAWLFVCLAAALPLFAHDAKVTLVVIDVEKNRAYVPEGTVLPPGKTVRASVTRVPMNGVTFETPRFGERSFSATARAQALRQEAPLVFEYAPAEKFAEARARYETFMARQGSGPKTQSHLGGCSYTYYTTSGTGVYGTYYSEFAEKSCSAYGGAYVWQTIGAGAAAEDEGYVYVNDGLNHWDCDDSGSGYRVRACENERLALTYAYPVNNVQMGGHTALIEWLNGYEPNYVWFNIEISFLINFD